MIFPLLFLAFVYYCAWYAGAPSLWYFLGPLPHRLVHFLAGQLLKRVPWHWQQCIVYPQPGFMPWLKNAIDDILTRLTFYEE